MVERPKKQFNLAAAEEQQLRDKDNAQPELKPKFSQRPRRNIAPPGCSGIKNNQPVPSHQKAKRFDIKKPDALKKEFNSLVSKTQDRSKDIDR